MSDEIIQVPHDAINALADNPAEDDVLRFVQTQRLVTLAQTYDDTELRLEILDSLGKTALGQKRIVSDAATGAKTADAVEAMAKVLTDIRSDPFLGSGGVRKPADVPTIVPLPEETSTELSTLTYEDIATN